MPIYYIDIKEKREREIEREESKYIKERKERNRER